MGSNGHRQLNKIDKVDGDHMMNIPQQDCTTLTLSYPKQRLLHLSAQIHHRGLCLVPYETVHPSIVDATNNSHTLECPNTSPWTVLYS